MIFSHVHPGSLMRSSSCPVIFVMVRAMMLARPRGQSPESCCPVTLMGRGIGPTAFFFPVLPILQDQIQNRRCTWSLP